MSRRIVQFQDSKRLVSCKLFGFGSFWDTRVFELECVPWSSNSLERGRVRWDGLSSYDRNGHIRSGRSDWNHH